MEKIHQDYQVGGSMLAIIPSIGISPLLPDLLNTLRQSGVLSIVVDNAQERTPAEQSALDNGAIYRHRPGWNIYKTWNLGIRLGALCNKNVLVLNDDIKITIEGIQAMDAALTSGWALLGFDYNLPVENGYTNKGIKEVAGSLRLGGVGGFAFGVNPNLCGRCHTGFLWYGGDDDLFYHTQSLGGKIGLMLGNPVTHETTTTGRHTMQYLPADWFEHDRQLLKQRWGTTW